MSRRDILRWAWEMNRFSILYVAWLIQTWFMAGLIVK